MSGLIHILVVGVSAFFISIPFLNTHVFRSPNINKVIVRGREGLNAVNDNLQRERFDAAVDTARKLIHEYRYDSLQFFVPDVKEWEALRTLLQSDEPSFKKSILLSHIPRNMRDSIEALDPEAHLRWDVKFRLVSAFNSIAADMGFYLNNREEISFSENSEAARWLSRLQENAIIVEQNGSYSLAEGIGEDEKNDLRRFHMVLLQQYIYPGILEKEDEYATTWAGEYIVQTAMYYLGVVYNLKKDIEHQIAIYDSLVQQYPNTIYAEQLFYKIGTILYKKGNRLKEREKHEEAYSAFGRAISYAERVEMNREVAGEFEKYRFRDLHIGKYVNLDKASIAKKDKSGTSRLYTLDKQKEEIAQEGRTSKGGFLLEDVIILIGKCYLARGDYDSARTQFSLIQTYFPESDNIDNAQLYIARTWIAQADSRRFADSIQVSERERLYRNAVNELTRFINLYIHSDSMSKAYIYLGDVYRELDSDNKANNAFQMALDNAKGIDQKARIQYYIGNYFFEEQLYDEAAETYSVVVTSYSSTKWAPRAQYYKAEAFYLMGDTAKAIEVYKNVVRYYKQSDLFSSAAMKVGNYYFQNDNYKDARKYFNLGYVYDQNGKLAPKLKFQSGMVWVEVAQQQKEQNNRPAAQKAYKEAIKQFRVVTQQYPNTRDADQAYFQIADCQVKLGNESEAREASNNIRSRDILVESIRLFGVGADNYEQELDYWRQAYRDAIEKEEKATIQYEIGNIWLEKAQKYDSALTYFRKATDFTEDHMKRVNARIGIARAFTKKQNYDTAAALYTSLLDDDRLGTELRKKLKLQLYDVYYMAESYKKAVDLYREFYTQYPDHALAAYARFREAKSYAAMEQHRTALNKMRQLIEKYPHADIYDQAKAGVGNQMIASGEVDEGVAYLKQFLNSEPLDSIASAAQVLLKLGNTYFSTLDNPSEAKQYFTKIVENFSHSRIYSFAAYKLGMCEKNLGNTDASIEAFQLVKKQDRKLYQAASAEIGKMLAETQPQRAIESYKKVVQMAQTEEESTIAMIGIGDVYMSIKEWGDAASTFKEVYKSYGGNDTALISGALIKWINALHNDKQYAATIRIADTMQARYPEGTYTINSYYFEAQSYFAQKRYSTASVRFEEIISRDESPRLTEIAYYQKADCYYFNKQYSSAIAHYNEYLKKYPDGNYAANALYMQGNAYWTQQQYSQATRKFQQILSTYSSFKNMCNVKRLLAYSLDKMGKWERALGLYNQVLSNSSCSSEAISFAKEQKEKILTQH